MPGKVKGQGHAKDRLSAAFVATVKEPGRYSDGLGMFLQIDATGSRRWVQRIMVNGRRHDIGIGPADIVGLAEARRVARANKAAALKGLDPLSEKRRAKGIPTFSEAASDVLAIKATELGNAKHLAQWKSTLATYAERIIGSRRVNEVDRQDMLHILNQKVGTEGPLWLVRTETAQRLRARIEAILDWATVSGHRTGENPARWKGNLEHLLASPSKVAKKEHHPAVAVEEAPSFWRVLSHGIPSIYGRRDSVAAEALRFLTLTWARSGEIRGAIWDEIDFDTRLWTIPASRMKMGREHRVPLTEAALALLRRLPKVEGCPLLFPGKGNKALSDMTMSKAMKALQKAADPESDDTGPFIDPRSGRRAVPHGLRSTARDWAAEQGYDRDMAEMQLAHDVGEKVERAYRRGDMLDRRRAMLEAWTSFLTGSDSAKVIQLRQSQ